MPSHYVVREFRVRLPGSCNAHARSIKPIRRHCTAHQNYLCVQVSQFKPLAQEIEEAAGLCERNAGVNFHPWKSRAIFAVQCFGLLYFDLFPIFRIFMPIHKSVGRRNM